MYKNSIINEIKSKIVILLKERGSENPEVIVENPPSPELGDMAIPMFKYSKELKKSPVQIGELIKKEIENDDKIEKIELKGAYLNIFFSKKSISKFLLKDILNKKEKYGELNNKNEKILVEFSCPNTNKPLHLGHCRNNALGDSISKILKKAGFEVKTINLINDRGIHICKSMLAYKMFGNSITPESANKKSDHLVGDFYVKYAIESEKDKELENKAQEMLVKWEVGDSEVVALWKTMNKWAIDGINETYNKMKIKFDFFQYESQTYKLGKDIVNEGLQKGVFYKEEDNSVWIDNEDVGLDKKILLRGDGTSIYITQDIGTAAKRRELFEFDRMIYVVGSEQIYHFKTLFEIFKKLGYEWGKNCYHLSYGMVNLPDGKMKSREGKVIDADNLIELLTELAYEQVHEKNNNWPEIEKKQTSEKIALSALKYYLLNVSTSKDIMFIPEKSISFDGNTGPYLQYVTSRIYSLINKEKINFDNIDFNVFDNYNFNDFEWFVINKLLDFENIIENFCYKLFPY